MDSRDDETTAGIDLTEDALENVRAAANVQVPAWLSLVSALASVRPTSVGATIDWLVEHRASLETAFSEAQAAPLAAARLAPDLRYEPELAGQDRARNDHLLRGRYVFRDLLERRSYFQVVMLAVSGIDFSDEDARLLEQIGVANMVADRRVWPLAVGRRIAAHGGDFVSAHVGATAVMGSRVMGAPAGAGVARFLRRLDAEMAAGKTLDEFMDEVIARREKVLGFGRPVAGPDERVPPVQALIRRAGRDQGTHMTRMRAVEARLARDRGLQTNVGAWVGALGTDLGLTPDGVHALCAMYLSPCVLAQVAFAGEQGSVARG
jgi:hypothetical protein